MRDAIVSTDVIEPTLNNWYRIQTVRRRRIRRTHQPRITGHNNRNRRGTMETSTSLQDAFDSNHSYNKLKNGKRFGATVPRQLTNAQYIDIMVATLMA
jgi:hypothetical protein